MPTYFCKGRSRPCDDSNETAMDEIPTKKPRKKRRDESDETAMNEIPTKRRKVDYSNVGTEDINSYRRAVVGVFISHSYKIQAEVKAIVMDFAGRAFAARFTSSQNMEFASIFEQFKTGFESCRSILEIQQRYQRFIDILLDIGGPVGVTGKEIEEELTNLTGK